MYSSKNGTKTELASVLVPFYFFSAKWIGVNLFVKLYLLK